MEQDGTAGTVFPRWAWAAVGLIVVILAGLAYGGAASNILWSYWFAAAIGIAVGATEMMARYRDAPFAPLLSIPGIFYFGINGAASALAYYLFKELDVHFKSEALTVLTAGLSAMAFFRSGLFTVRIGSDDVAVGPNLVLQILLQALDRSYDRTRATPRSLMVARIMAGVSFAQAQLALPGICFNLMQNVADEEKEAIRREVDELAKATDMSDEAKTLILGLSLFNVVGDQTLEAAVNALGNTVKGFKRIDTAMVLELAKVAPKDVLTSLPVICNDLADVKVRVPDPSKLMENIQPLNINDECKAILTLYRLVRQYGEATVSIALSTMHP